MTDKIEEIPLDNIKVQKFNVRTHDIDVGIEDLAANIKANGLLQPIAAYLDSASQNYVILTGQRRLNAYHLLNKQYPNECFDKIKCLLIDEPISDEKKLSLSLAENITQLPMTNPDLIKAVTDLYNVYGDYEMVQQEFGITQSMIRKYVRLARLPPRLKEAIEGGEIHHNPKTAENAALGAVDATNYTKNGSVSEDHVLALAVELAKSEINNKDLASEARKGGSAGDIITRAKTKQKQKFNIELNPDTAEKLDVVAKTNGEAPKLKAAQYVIDGVDKDYGQLS